jgi:hypothetical protein
VDAKEMIEEVSGFITVRELNRVKDSLEEDFRDEIKTVRDEVKRMNTKFDGMKDLFLPLAKGFEMFTETQKETNVLLIENQKEQRLTNGLMGEQINKQGEQMKQYGLEILGLHHVTKEIKDKKKNSFTLIGIVVTAVGGIIIALVNVAPLIFNR